MFNACTRDDSNYNSMSTSFEATTMGKTITTEALPTITQYHFKVKEEVGLAG
jgi:hypothetical protein